MRILLFFLYFFHFRLISALYYYKDIYGISTHTTNSLLNVFNRNESPFAYDAKINKNLFNYKQYNDQILPSKTSPFTLFDLCRQKNLNLISADEWTINRYHPRYCYTRWSKIFTKNIYEDICNNKDVLIQLEYLDELDFLVRYIESVNQSHVIIPVGIRFEHSWYHSSSRNFVPTPLLTVLLSMTSGIIDLSSAYLVLEKFNDVVQFKVRTANELQQNVLKLQYFCQPQELIGKKPENCDENLWQFKGKIGRTKLSTHCIIDDCTFQLYTPSPSNSKAKSLIAKTHRSNIKIYGSSFCGRVDREDCKDIEKCVVISGICSPGWFNIGHHCYLFIKRSDEKDKDVCNYFDAESYTGERDKLELYDSKFRNVIICYKSKTLRRSTGYKLKINIDGKQCSIPYKTDDNKWMTGCERLNKTYSFCSNKDLKCSTDETFSTFNKTSQFEENFNIKLNETKKIIKTCRNDGILINGTCYTFVFNTLLGWKDASKYCRKNFQGELASIHSYEENSILTFIAMEYRNSTYLWIGLNHEKIRKLKGPSVVFDVLNFLSPFRRRHVKVKLSWLDKSPVDYVNYMHGDLLAHKRYDCGLLHTRHKFGGHGEWVNGECSLKAPFICQYKPLDQINEYESSECEKNSTTMIMDLCLIFSDGTTKNEVDRKCNHLRSKLIENDVALVEVVNKKNEIFGKYLKNDKFYTFLDLVFDDKSNVYVWSSSKEKSKYYLSNDIEWGAGSPNVTKGNCIYAEFSRNISTIILHSIHCDRKVSKSMNNICLQQPKKHLNNFVKNLIESHKTEKESEKKNGTCFTDWHRIGNGCYYLIKEKLDWGEARKLCSEHSLDGNEDLAWFNSRQEENKILKYFIQKFLTGETTTSLWIGLIKRTGNRGFRWLRPFLPMKYVRTIKSRSEHGSSCIASTVGRFSKYWSNFYCTTPHYGLCRGDLIEGNLTSKIKERNKKKKFSNIAGTLCKNLIDRHDAKSTYLPLTDKCLYYLPASTLSQNDLKSVKTLGQLNEKICRSLHAFTDIVSIQSEAENRFIYEFANGAKGLDETNCVHIGLQLSKNSWIDGTGLTYSNIYIRSKFQHYTMKLKNGLWEFIYKWPTTKCGYVCQIPLYILQDHIKLRVTSKALLNEMVLQPTFDKYLKQKQLWEITKNGMRKEFKKYIPDSDWQWENSELLKRTVRLVNSISISTFTKLLAAKNNSLIIPSLSKSFNCPVSTDSFDGNCYFTSSSSKCQQFSSEGARIANIWSRYEANYIHLLSALLGYDLIVSSHPTFELTNSTKMETINKTIIMGQEQVRRINGKQFSSAKYLCSYSQDNIHEITFCLMKQDAKIECSNSNTFIQIIKSFISTSNKGFTNCGHIDEGVDYKNTSFIDTTSLVEQVCNGRNDCPIETNNFIKILERNINSTSNIIHYLYTVTILYQCQSKQFAMPNDIELQSSNSDLLGRSYRKKLKECRIPQRFQYNGKVYNTNYCISTMEKGKQWPNVLNYYLTHINIYSPLDTCQLMGNETKMGKCVYATSIDYSNEKGDRCKAGYYRYGMTNCLSFKIEPNNYANAEAICKKDNAHLVIIDSIGIIQFITSIYHNFKFLSSPNIQKAQQQVVWIGASLPKATKTIKSFINDTRWSDGIISKERQYFLFENSLYFQYLVLKMQHLISKNATSNDYLHSTLPLNIPNLGWVLIVRSSAKKKYKEKIDQFYIENKLLGRVIVHNRANSLPFICSYKINENKKLKPQIFCLDEIYPNKCLYVYKKSVRHKKADKFCRENGYTLVSEDLLYQMGSILQNSSLPKNAKIWTERVNRKCFYYSMKSYEVVGSFCYSRMKYVGCMREELPEEDYTIQRKLYTQIQEWKKWPNDEETTVSPTTIINSLENNEEFTNDDNGDEQFEKLQSDETNSQRKRKPNVYYVIAIFAISIILTVLLIFIVTIRKKYNRSSHNENFPRFFYDEIIGILTKSDGNNSHFNLISAPSLIRNPIYSRLNSNKERNISEEVEAENVLDDVMNSIKKNNNIHQSDS
ncbi:hypothetical protein SNEBB_006246 [Seison nebaliae]|nr:hypothetical protein SNEBB_006246 [Seison nebaliae]